ncbi:hypothetical protein [Xaviernesmea oryzae]|nr:hypothetical protein [Xaviernesmea oryzae]
MLNEGFIRPGVADPAMRIAAKATLVGKRTVLIKPEVLWLMVYYKTLILLLYKILIISWLSRNEAQSTWETNMTIKVICLAATLSVAAISQASAGGLLGGGGHKGGLNLGLGISLGNGSIVVAPNVGVLNGSNVNVLNGILSGNSILNGNAILSGNNGLLGLGILGNGNVSKKYVRR